MNNIDWKADIESIKQIKVLKENEVIKICEKAREIFLKEPNIVKVRTPVTVCGDIHGQFEDLLELFQVGGSCPETSYLFLGDYVDRGFNSVETFILFLLLKIKYEDRLTLLRGNHESRQITQVYGFYDECLRKFGSSNIWRNFVSVFDTIPIAGLIDNKLFCLHGGLSPNLSKIENLNSLKRFGDVPIEGVISDLLWSDPEPEVTGFEMSPRGAGFLFGEDVTIHFCAENNIDLVIRAHQLVMEGYKFMFKDKLVTVWSAPNYCYRCGNVASVMEVDDNLEWEFKIFEASPPEMRNVPEKKKVPEYFL